MVDVADGVQPVVAVTRRLYVHGEPGTGSRPTVSRPMSSVRGARPVAKRISSASIRSPPSVVTRTVPFSLVTDFTEVPVRIRAPAS
ncbi:hypothetical protein GCM10023238_00640 [Streptomyces heliomycini]